MTSERTSLMGEAAGRACALALLFASMSACSGDVEIGSRSAALVAVCSDPDGGVPEGGWLCPASRTVECDQGNGTAAVDWIYVVPPADDAGGSCEGRDVVVDDPGPFALGTHTVSVTQSGDGGEFLLCSAELVVVDSEPPVPTSKSIVLWPPNHSMHTITPDDCVHVEDRCDGVVHARFTSVTSDEPENDRGDGNSAPDAIIDADSVQVRAERQGGGDGRVYRIGFEAEDAAGNLVQGECLVEVPHDASHHAALRADGG